MVDQRQFLAAQFFGNLYALFDIANGVEILREFGPIALGKRPLELRHLLAHRVKNALMLLQSFFASGTVRAAAVAKQLFEYRPRIPLHGQRLCRAPPRQGVCVGAAQVTRAGACVSRQVHRKLKRCHLRFPGEMSRQ